MKRNALAIVLDTETANSLEFAFVYDIGWVIVNKYTGEIITRRNFVNKDIFINEKTLMQTAYYNNKLPQYYKEIENGERILASTFEIRMTLLADISKYGIYEIYAHNARFDYKALTITQRWVTKSKYRYYFPKDIVICDTLKMSRDVLGKMPSYKKFCIENGYMTNHKNPQLKFTAEVIYRYIKRNTNFIERHTALADAEIEAEIMCYLYGQHKKMRKHLWND